MTRIVSVGFPQQAIAGGAPPAAALPAPLSRDDLDDLVDLGRGGDELIVVYPRRVSEPTLQRLQTAQAALQREGFCWHAVDASPLVGCVLVSLASALTAHVPGTGRLLASLPSLQRQLLWVTWLSRVSGLDDPAPRMSDHLRSLSPFASYAAVSWPQPRLVRVRAGEGVLDLPRPVRAVGLALSDLRGDVEWVRRAVMPALGEPQVNAIEPPEGSAAFWGTKRFTEVVIYPIDIPALGEALNRRVTVEQCRWCDRSGGGETCPFCGALRRVAVPTADLDDVEELAPEPA